MLLILAAMFAVLVGSQAAWGSTSSTLYQWLQNLAPNSTLNSPTGIASVGNTFYVTDTGNNQIQVIPK